jgi:archaetidylinositol phosphate synthase
VNRDVRVVILALGELGNTVYERHRLDEVAEAEDALERAVGLAPTVRQGHRGQYARMLAPSRKQRPSFEVVCELVYRPLAHLVVLALLPLRVPPPAVVAASGLVGIGGAVEIGRGNLLLAALLLQVKTVLDNADGQLARASGRVTAFGRYLDSESDLLVNAAIFVGLGWVTGEPWLAAIAFAVLTLVLSADFNLERLYRRELGETADAAPTAEGAAAALARVYAVVYAPQDRLIEAFVSRRARGRASYHDRATLSILANFGLSTQLAALGICLALGHPAAYFWVVLGCGVTLIPLELRRERLPRKVTPVP